MPADCMSPERALWPAAKWPTSWAMTPCSSFGSSDSRIRPVLKPMTRGPAKALSSFDPTRTISTFLGSMPAALRIGSESLARISSISVSRIRDCADAGAAVSARPVTAAAVRARRETDRRGEIILGTLS